MGFRSRNDHRRRRRRCCRRIVVGEALVKIIRQKKQVRTQKRVHAREKREEMRERAVVNICMPRGDRKCTLTTKRQEARRPDRTLHLGQPTVEGES